jgi:DNA-binding MarR family transcriptional regulator
MPQYRRAAGAVKDGVRSQRKPIAHIPDEHFEEHRRRFPDDFDRDTVVAMFTLRALAQRINDRTNEWLAPFELNAAKYNYLVVLYLNSGESRTLNAISSLIHTSNATVTSMIASLERDGLVRRKPHPADGRSTLVMLTAKGRRRIEAAIPVQRRNVDAGMRRLSADERAQLAALLLKVSNGFDQDDDDHAAQGVRHS